MQSHKLFGVIGTFKCFGVEECAPTLRQRLFGLMLDLNESGPKITGKQLAEGFAKIDEGVEKSGSKLAEFEKINGLDLANLENVKKEE